MLNLPWLWDRAEVNAVPALFSAVRWQRGPVTFYMHRVAPDVQRPEDFHTTWVFCWADDWSIAIHFPAKVTRWLERRLKTEHVR